MFRINLVTNLNREAVGRASLEDERGLERVGDFDRRPPPVLDFSLEFRRSLKVK